MVFTTTAAAFILLSLGLAFLGWRFLLAFRKVQNPAANSKTGLLLGLCFATTALHNGILGFGALFFANNSEALYLISIIAHFFLTLFAVVSIYTVYYIFLPQRLPYSAIIITSIISILGLLTNISVPSKPFVTPQNGIDWNMNFLFAITTFYLFLISLSALFYIFMQLFRKAKIREIKTLSFIIVISTLIGITATFVRLILLYNVSASVRTSILDIGIAIIGSIFIIAFVIIPLIINLFKRQKRRKRDLIVNQEKA